MFKAQARVHSYDKLSVAIHWTVAVLVIGLFASGLWMVELDYYDSWYYLAPLWHKTLGVTLLILVLLRFAWMLVRLAPSPVASISNWQHKVARIVHATMNMLMLTIAISGYLIVTAEGDSLSLAYGLEIPAIFHHQSDWVDPAGTVHLFFAYTLIFLACIHALAAAKHHFIDKDATLWRMLGINKGEKI